MSLFFTAYINKERGIEKSFGRQKMLGTAEQDGVIFFGTKGEDRNSFVSIYRHKFAVQKQRISDGAMKNASKGRQKTGKREAQKVKTNHTDMPAKPYSYPHATSGMGKQGNDKTAIRYYKFGFTNGQ